MEIEKVVKYQVGNELFSTKEEAEDFLRCSQVDGELIDIINSFMYDGADVYDVLEGLKYHKDNLIKVLSRI